MKPYDLAVIGAGPAGSAAAARASALGLKTLVMEKKVFPRAKVCTGMIMGGLAGETAGRTFAGWPPQGIYSRRLRGIAQHVGDLPVRLLKWPITVYWRRELDAWMVDRAARAGAQVVYGAEYRDLEKAAGGFKIHCQAGPDAMDFVVSHVVGADGGVSRVRKLLYPEVEVNYAYGFQQLIEGTADLDPDYFHVFTASDVAPYYVSIIFKEGRIAYEGGAAGRDLAAMRRWGKELLVNRYGLKVQSTVSEQSCREPVLYHSWFGGQPLQGRGGILLAGDAAGLLMPGTGEGIGFALFSGVSAAEAFARGNQDPSQTYLDMIRGKVDFMRNAYQGVRQLRKAAGERALLDALERLWRNTLLAERGVVNQRGLDDSYAGDCPACRQGSPLH